MLKVIPAIRKSMPQFQGPKFWNLGLEQNFPTKLEERKNCYLNKRIDWYSGIQIFHVTVSLKRHNLSY